jgi:hypothetical protein
VWHARGSTVPELLIDGMANQVLRGLYRQGDRNILEDSFLEEGSDIEPAAELQLFLDKLDDAIGTLHGTAESLRNLT